ncbi:phosphoenolpyruvate synthase [Christiangramia sediminis]|uniref:Phosphoenolpyruvate synthase n=1 Tax=Christiangramia sediminis TaxID=2881336 RepID=A0A9X1RWW6_9FLAO|nr:phosphoenolpyruvate synthase [Christiangramia sediminis]MCB7481041.1 phosphoenolpyruvate synthase [Christiangramia sediminis]
MEALVVKFQEIGLHDIAMVGGKNASLGEMYNELSGKGIHIPNGFATTAKAFRIFLKENNIRQSLINLLNNLDRKEYSNLEKIGSEARKLIMAASFSEKFTEEIKLFYRELSGNEPIEVAVRSSATAEDLPTASFAGQHETYLNIKGEVSLMEAVKKCFASLYTDRAIKYREDKGFKHDSVALSVGVQKMVRSDAGCSGIAFTIDPESGFKEVIHLSGVWGLGENIVQGTVNPDEFYVFKPTLKQGKNAIIQKKMGDKAKTMIYADSNGHSSITNINTEVSKQNRYILTDAEVLQLSKWCLAIEDHYNKPMDIEWAKDGITQNLFITQARPETVHHSKSSSSFTEYKLKEQGEVLVTGSAIGSKIVIGTARILDSPRDSHKLESGDIIVTDNTSPDWDPLLKKAGGIITNSGGRTSHAAIVARELGVPAVVGTNNATNIIRNGEPITVSCAEGSTGKVYKGQIHYVENKINFDDFHLPKTEAKFILADPDKAFELSFYPNNGVGLLRMEFIITHMIKAHPMALVKFQDLLDSAAKNQIEILTKNYPSKEVFFIDKLSQGIGTIAAAFYPKEVIVRMSDFKTNEYANLIGGQQFEPKEENPMLGFRGASRYYSELYSEGFKLECEAIKRVRDEMGLFNVKVMIPFCRTLEEGKKVIDIMANYGLQQKVNDLEIYMMIEIPSNIILASEFAKIFDGFSIGSNDLTQLMLGVDRDSQLMAEIFDENDPAVKQMIALAIKKAKESGIKIGLCGQAPSDFPEFAIFLINNGIDSISYNPDALIKGIKNMNIAEREVKV